MEHLFQFHFSNFTDYAEYPVLGQFQPASIQSDDYCEEVIQDGKKYHSCTFPNCGKTFRFKSEFNRHRLTHTPSRPLDCPYTGCSKTFKREDALKNHMRIHTGELPFQCEVPGCEQSFPTKAGLRYHYLKHKGDKENRCSFPGCNKTFLTMSQLKQHENALNYHQKMQTTVPELKKVNEKAQDLFLDDFFDTEVQQVEKKVKTETVKVGKGKDMFMDGFVEPEVKQIEKLEWGFQAQEDAELGSTDANDGFQSDFERMVKKILTENTEMKKKLDMCSTLMGLMQENKELKSKLNKVGQYETPIQMQPTAQDFSDDQIFSFLNFDC